MSVDWAQFGGRHTAGLSPTDALAAQHRGLGLPGRPSPNGGPCVQRNPAVA